MTKTKTVAQEDASNSKCGPRALPACRPLHYIKKNDKNERSTLEKQNFLFKVSQLEVFKKLFFSDFTIRMT